MTPILRLPVRESILPGESLSSLVRRTAQGMGYESVGRLTGLQGKERCCFSRLDQLAQGPQLESLASLLGHDIRQLSELTVHRWADALTWAPRNPSTPGRMDAKTVLRYFRLAAPAICPRCLLEEPAYHRLQWAFRPVVVCSRHRCWLNSIPSSRERLLNRGNIDATAAPDSSVADSVIEGSQMMESWLNGISPLVGTPTAGAWGWLERLAVAVQKTPAWIDRSRHRWSIPVEIANEAVSWLAAADLLIDWPTRLFEFLDEFQLVDKPTLLATGTSRAFGRLLREAANLETDGFGAPADVLRAYLVKRFTRGHLNGKVCLFHAPSIEE